MQIVTVSLHDLQIMFDRAAEKVIQAVRDGNAPSTQPETDQLLTIQQAAELISLSVPTLYTLVHKAEIPVSKRGKRLYFSKQELTDWIKAGRKKTVAEINSEADTF